jgi:DNA replication protein DnaC
MHKTTDPDGLDRLIQILQTLRLRHIADEIPTLLSQAARDEWGQLDLLLEVFGHEAFRRSQSRFERNLKASGLTEAYGLDHYDYNLGRAHGVEEHVVKDLAQCEFIRDRRNLILSGGVGTGKTFLARTLGIEALKRGFKVYSYTTASLLNELYRKRNSFQFGKLYAQIRNVDLLLLDDLAYLPYSPEKVEFLFSLIVDRYEFQCGSAIVTSNTDVTDWWQFFPSKAMGLAFSDRLLDRAQGIRLTGESIRKNRTKRRRKKPTKDKDAT